MRPRQRPLRSGATLAALTLVLALVAAPAASAGLLEPKAGNGTPPFAKTYAPLLTAPSLAGRWDVLPYRVPGLAVHSTVLNDGRVLVVEGSGNDKAQFAAGTFNVWSWDTGAGTFSKVPQLPNDLFCGGHAVLPDGKVLFLGGTAAYPDATQGHLGLRSTYEFDPITNKFTHEPDMANGRWYPSAVEQGDGKVLAVSGANGVDSSAVTRSESFDPETSTWSALPGNRLFPFYPALTLLQDGRVFFAGVGSGASDSHPPGVWNTSDNSFVNAPYLPSSDRRNQAGTVLMPPAQKQQIGVFGGGGTDGSGDAVANSDIYDVSSPDNPRLAATAALRVAKLHVLSVILPDETVFETGGSLGFANKPVAEAAIYNPALGMWRSMNVPTVPRSYHAEAVLLPDGRVATLGSNPDGYAEETRIEVFSPPYMFSGQRPAIDAAPDAAGYGSTIGVHVAVGSGASLKKVVLVKPGSVTHSVDPNQRLVEITVNPTGGGNANVTLPNNPNLAPPGWYMMFALDSSNRPSVAHWVHVDRD